MITHRFNAICFSLFSVLAVACGDAGNAGLEENAGFGEQDGDAGFGGQDGDAGFGGQDGDAGFGGQDGDAGFGGQDGDTGFAGAGGAGGAGDEGEDLIAPADDEVDPYSLTVVFDEGEVSVADAVSYPLGDTQDVVFYRVDRRFALGQLEITAFCYGEGVENIEFVHSLGGDTFNCDPTGTLVVDRLVGPEIPGFGSVTITALAGTEATQVDWILEGVVKPR